MANPYLLSSAGPGLTVSSSGSNATLAIGDTISLSAGTTTKLDGGATASLSIGPTTSINLGTTITFDASQTVSFSVSKAKKIYASDKTETAESTINSATKAYIIQGGTVPTPTNVARVSAKKEIFVSLMAATISLAATIMGSIYGLEHPPIAVSSSSDDTSADYSDQQSSSFSGLEILITTLVVTITQIASVQMLFNKITPTPVAVVTLDDNGFSVDVTPEENKQAAKLNFIASDNASLPTFTAESTIATQANTFHSFTMSDDTTDNVITLQTGLDGSLAPVLSLKSSPNAMGQILLALPKSDRNDLQAIPNSIATFSMDQKQTSINRTTGNASITIGDTNPGTLLMSAGNVTVSSGASSVVVTPTNIAIGCKSSMAATFTPSDIKIGGMTITSGQISIGDALVVNGLTSNVSSAINSVQNQLSDALAEYKISMQSMSATLVELKTQNELLSDKVALLQNQLQKKLKNNYLSFNKLKGI